MIEGLVIIGVGIILIICRKTLVKDRAAFQKYHFNIKLRSKEVRWEEIGVTVAGVLLIILGVLSLLGVVEFK